MATRWRREPTAATVPFSMSRASATESLVVLGRIVTMDDPPVAGTAGLAGAGGAEPFVGDKGEAMLSEAHPVIAIRPTMATNSSARVEIKA